MDTSSPATPRDLLRAWLRARLPANALTWLDDATGKAERGERAAFFLAFGMVMRKTSKADLALTPEERADADKVRPGWDPSGWTVDQAARSLLVLSLPAEPKAALVETLDHLFAAGEVQELVALYQ